MRPTYVLEVLQSVPPRLAPYPLSVASSNPFRRGSQGWGMIQHQNHVTGEANGSVMVGMIVCWVLLALSRGKAVNDITRSVER